MTLYVDSSAFAKRYLDDEIDHDACIEIMNGHARWVTSRLTSIEAARAIARSGGDARAVEATTQRLDVDLAETLLVELHPDILEVARSVAVDTGVRTLDAIQLASAMQLPSQTTEVLTFDRQQAAAATYLGLRLAR